MLYLVVREVKGSCITTLEGRRRRRRIVYVVARVSTARYTKQGIKSPVYREPQTEGPSVTEARLLSLSTDVSAKEGGFDPVHTD